MSVDATPLLGDDEREILLQLDRHPRSLAVLAENLGLSGTTGELRAMCDAVDNLEHDTLIEIDETAGFKTVRYRLSAPGARWLRARDVAAMQDGIRARRVRVGGYSLRQRVP